jgi:hypothetical protein
MLGAAPGLVASLLPLLAMTAAGAAVYALALYLTWRASGAHPGAERHVMEVLGGIRRPRAQPRASY